MKKELFLATCCLAILAGVVQQSSAALITYTDRSAWELALGGTGIQTENFNSFSYTVFDPGTYTLGALGLEVTNDPTDYITKNTVQSGGTDDIDGSKYFRGVARQTIGPTLTFNNPVYGFGGDWTGVDGQGQLTVNIGGETFDLPQIIGDEGFFGVLSDTTFDEAALRAKATTVAEYFGLDNVVFSENSPSFLSGSVPEPSSLAIFGLGACLAGLRCGRRRNRKTARV